MKIIAEVGSNWSTFDDCLTSIQLAKACGADAVKFQAFSRSALYGKPDFAEPMPGELNVEWLPKLAHHAEKVGIFFMCSAFSPELAELVNPHVATHKVASAECTHLRLLEKLNSFGKHVILSTGSMGLEDIRRATLALKDVPVTILYCVSEYPARYINFEKMKLLKKAFPTCEIGYSDHSTDIIEIPRWARMLGATVIEKHVNFVGATGADAPHSLTTDEFKLMCKSLRGEPVPDSIGENDMRSTHNRRLIATADISVGAKLIEGVNFGIYRALSPMPDALSPWLVNEVAGKHAREAIKAGEGITRSNLVG